MSKEKESGALNWLSKVKFNEEKGELKIMGQRHALAFNGLFADLRERMRSVVGNAADAMIYDCAREHVRKVIEYYLNHLPPLKLIVKTKRGRNEIAKRVAPILAAYGYGCVELEKLDLEKETVLAVKNSFVADYYVRNKIKSDRPVCSLIAGFIAGAAEAITGKEYECREMECIAKGDKVCRFVVRKVEE